MATRAGGGGTSTIDTAKRLKDAARARVDMNKKAQATQQEKYKEQLSILRDEKRSLATRQKACDDLKSTLEKLTKAETALRKAKDDEAGLSKTINEAKLGEKEAAVKVAKERLDRKEKAHKEAKGESAKQKAYDEMMEASKKYFTLKKEIADLKGGK